MALVRQECGFEVMCALWEHMSGINIYVSEKDLFEAKKRYIQKFYDKDNPEFDVMEGSGTSYSSSQRPLKRLSSISAR
jgi:hypothetical protein